MTERKTFYRDNLGTLHSVPLCDRAADGSAGQKVRYTLPQFLLTKHCTCVYVRDEEWKNPIEEVRRLQERLDKRARDLGRFTQVTTTRIKELEGELAAWRRQCDLVGVPYSPEGLVRHHRGNAGLAAEASKKATEQQLRNAQAAIKHLLGSLSHHHDTDWEHVIRYLDPLAYKEIERARAIEGDPKNL